MRTSEFRLNVCIRLRRLNAGFGGTGGIPVKFDAETHQLLEYRPPKPGVTFYQCLPQRA
jgi:hypothetical protein